MALFIAFETCDKSLEIINTLHLQEDLELILNLDCWLLWLFMHFCLAKEEPSRTLLRKYVNVQKHGLCNFALTKKQEPPPAALCVKLCQTPVLVKCKANLYLCPLFFSLSSVSYSVPQEMWSQGKNSNIWTFLNSQSGSEQTVFKQIKKKEKAMKNNNVYSNLRLAEKIIIAFVAAPSVCVCACVCVSKGTGGLDVCRCWWVGTSGNLCWVKNLKNVQTTRLCTVMCLYWRNAGDLDFCPYLKIRSLWLEPSHASTLFWKVNERTNLKWEWDLSLNARL